MSCAIKKQTHSLFCMCNLQGEVPGSFVGLNKLNHGHYQDGTLTAEIQNARLFFFFSFPSQCQTNHPRQGKNCNKPQRGGVISLNDFRGEGRLIDLGPGRDQFVISEHQFAHIKIKGTVKVNFNQTRSCNLSLRSHNKLRFLSNQFTLFGPSSFRPASLKTIFVLQEGK